MKAMIFAAGLGSRFKPLTENLPKALVEVNGKTLLERCIVYLKQYGITDIVINVHHFASQIISFCNERNFGVNIIISDESDELLDTGGGLKKACHYFTGVDPVVVVNADIITDLNIDKMRSFHVNSDNVATLAVRDRHSSRKLLFNKQLKLVGWRNTKTNETIEVHSLVGEINELAFSGLHIVSPKVFQHFPNQNSFSIIKFYLEAAKYLNVGSYLCNEGYWFDVGTEKKYEKAKQFFENHN